MTVALSKQSGCVCYRLLICFLCAPLKSHLWRRSALSCQCAPNSRRGWERAGGQGHPQLQLRRSPAVTSARGGEGEEQKTPTDPQHSSPAPARRVLACSSASSLGSIKHHSPAASQKQPRGSPSPVDLEAWTRLAGPYREDPERVSRVFETILKTQNPDWGVIQVLLNTLLDSTEREIVLRTARKEVDRIGTAGALAGTVEEHFPSQDPHWDPNTKEGRVFLGQYQQWILFGFRHAMPKVINWSKLYELKQEPHETPTAFVERLRATARRYTNIDPEKPEEAVQLAPIFIGNSAPDIRKKLQKLEGAESRDLGELLQVAWIVFNNRGEEEQNKTREREKEKEQKEKRRETECEERKKKREAEREEREKKREGERKRRGRGGDAMLSAALQVALFRRRAERGAARGALQPNQCAYCRALGHWKRECPKNRNGPRQPGCPCPSNDG